MDEELSVALISSTPSTAEAADSETAVAPATESATGTNIFWGVPAFGAAVMRGERMERTVIVEVFGYGS
jgi:hypothetical protein